jgi:hypothetical protein
VLRTVCILDTPPLIGCHLALVSASWRCNYKRLNRNKLCFQRRQLALESNEVGL